MPHAQPDLVEKIQQFLCFVKKQPVDAFEIVASVQSGFTATARMGDAENLEHHREVGASVFVYHNARTGSASASDLSLSALQQTFEKARSIAQFTEPDTFNGLADRDLMAYGYPDLALSHSWNITPKVALEKALLIDEAARAADSRITQVEEAVVSTADSYYFYANSHGFIGHYGTTQHGISVSVVAKQQDSMERDFDYCYSCNAADLKPLDAIAHKAVNNAVRRLNATKITTRRCPVIFERRVARSLLGHLITAISGGHLYRKTSFLVDALGKKLLPDFITIGQKPHLLSGYGSAPFDQQGVKTRDLNYIEQGVLTNYVLSNYSAKKLGMVTTGNAGGVFNLFINHSNKKFVDLCKDMGTGLLVTELIGQGVNIMTGDYSRGASGFWVENGEIQYPVHEITIAGNLRDMFSGIVAVGNDVEPLSNIVTGSIAIDQMTVAGC